MSPVRPGNADITDNGTVSVVGALTVGSLGGSGSVVLGTGILTFGGKSTATTGTLPSFTYTGVISGTNPAAGISKAGTGTETFTSAQAYAGGTTVTNGTLVVGVNNTFPTTSAILVTGGTLAFTTFSQSDGSGLQDHRRHRQRHHRHPHQFDPLRY